VLHDCIVIQPLAEILIDSEVEFVESDVAMDDSEDEDNWRQERMEGIPISAPKNPISLRSVGEQQHNGADSITLPPKQKPSNSERTSMLCSTPPPCIKGRYSYNRKQALLDVCSL
jgi:hypothetical protein